MKNMKPVWRMNTDNGVPRDYGGLAISVTGKLDSYQYNLVNNMLWRLNYKSNVNIAAYQTTRYKEAKR